MSGKTAKDYEGTYTEPELRERLKEEIKGGDRGGRPGQWSARKSELLVHEYEAAGGGYKTSRDEPSESQAHLKQWESEDWQTADGSERARDGATTKRYLPKAAWEKLTPKERRETDAKKQSGGTQDVANTGAAKEAKKAAELADLKVADAKKRLSKLSEGELKRAKKGEERKTLLEAIDAELARR